MLLRALFAVMFLFNLDLQFLVLFPFPYSVHFKVHFLAMSSHHPRLRRPVTNSILTVLGLHPRHRWPVHQSVPERVSRHPPRLRHRRANSLHLNLLHLVLDIVSLEFQPLMVRFLNSLHIVLDIVSLRSLMIWYALLFDASARPWRRLLVWLPRRPVLLVRVLLLRFVRNPYAPRQEEPRTPTKAMTASRLPPWFLLSWRVRVPDEKLQQH